MQLTSERARETSIEREREREIEIDWLLLRQCGKGLSLWPVQAPHPVIMFWGRGPTKVSSVVAHSDHRTGKGPFCVALDAMIQNCTHCSISLGIIDELLWADNYLRSTFCRLFRHLQP